MKKTYEITDEVGLHARPATVLVSEASKYISDIEIGVNENNMVNLKSIMGVMSLGVAKGGTVIVEANGKDAEEALTAITTVMNEEKLGREI